MPISLLQIDLELANKMQMKIKNAWNNYKIIKGLRRFLFAHKVQAAIKIQKYAKGWIQRKKLQSLYMQKLYRDLSQVQEYIKIQNKRLDFSGGEL